MSKNTCPICRGEIHAIAGRCKHCKSDLVELRERTARAARAQTLGATVPPAPRTLSFAATSPRPATIPPDPAGYSTGPVLPLEVTGTAPFAGGEYLASTVAGRAATVPPLGPENRLPHLTLSPNGTPTYGLGFAGGRTHRASTWSRRWPFVVSAVALLAIGVSIGVLAERWRRDAEARAASQVQQGHLARRPVMVPDPMPEPIIPGLPTPRTVPDPDPRDRDVAPPPSASPRPPRERQPEPESEPDGQGGERDSQTPDSSRSAAPDLEPDRLNPGSRFSQPPSGEPASAARAFRTFTTSLTESLCQKLTQCGLIDSATQSMCRAFAQELDPDDAADKVARGECSFNQRAADACLQAVSDLRCDMGSSDRMWDWLMAPNRVGECAEAYVCQ